MEDLNVKNGKIQLDDGSEIDLKPAIQPPVDYGDWESDEDIALIKINIDEDISYFKDKDVNYHELYFIEDDFWFDFGEFYFILNSKGFQYGFQTFALKCTTYQIIFNIRAFGDDFNSIPFFQTLYHVAKPF